MSSCVPDHMVGGYGVTKRWPNHINLELLKLKLCQASEEDLLLQVAELRERYVRLNGAVRSAKKYRNQLTRSCTDNQQSLEIYEEKVRVVDTCLNQRQLKLEQQNQMASQYDCEVRLLQNQLPPKLPPCVTGDLDIGTDLDKLSHRIFEMYAALLVLRAGQVILFEDMERTVENRPLLTRQTKNSILELRKRIRHYENSIFTLTEDQKKWKNTLKAGKLNICRRAKQQHNGLKEEAAKLKRTIGLFKEEKNKLTLEAQEFEQALSTTIGEKDLADLMEHFETFSDSANQLQHLAKTETNAPGSTTGNLRSIFKKPQSGMPNVFAMRKTSGVPISVLQNVDRVSLLQKLYLDSIATKVKMEGNLLRTDFDIGLLETSLTGESYYDRMMPEEERRKMIKGIVADTTSEELLSVNDNDVADFFHPEAKFPGRNP